MKGFLLILLFVTGISGIYIIVHALGWLPLLGIILLTWSNNINLQLARKNDTK